MLQDLLKKQLQQLWLGPRPSISAETPTYGQIPAWHASMNGADDHCTLLVKAHGWCGHPLRRPSNRPRCLRHVGKRCLTVRSTCEPEKRQQRGNGRDAGA